MIMIIINYCSLGNGRSGSRSSSSSSSSSSCSSSIYNNSSTERIEANHCIYSEQINICRSNIYF